MGAESAPNRWMIEIDQDYFMPYMSSIFIDEIRIKDLEIRIFLPDPSFRSLFNIHVGLHLYHSEMLRPPSCLGPRSSHPAPAYLCSNHDKTLLRLVAESSSSVEPRRSLYSLKCAAVPPINDPTPNGGVTLLEDLLPSFSVVVHVGSNF